MTPAQTQREHWSGYVSALKGVLGTCQLTELDRSRLERDLESAEVALARNRLWAEEDERAVREYAMMAINGGNER